MEYTSQLSVKAPVRLYNPVQKDYATIIKSSEETNGEYTLIEVELSPFGGNGLHYHKSFTERFEPIDRPLHVQVGDEIKVVKPGHDAIVPALTLHRFFNPTETSIRFNVELRPGNINFENCLKIAYGLAVDGLTDNKSLPKNFYHLAVCFNMGETYVPGFLSYITPLFALLARRARKNGIEAGLLRKYCTG